MSHQKLALFIWTLFTLLTLTCNVGPPAISRSNPSTETPFRALPFSTAAPSSATPSSVPAATPMVRESADVYLNPFCNCAETVPAGKRIFLTFRWAAASEALVREFISAVSYTPVYVSSGKPNQKSTYWTAPEYSAKDRTFTAAWVSELPWLDPGGYSVKTQVMLSRAVTDGFDNNNDGRLDQFGPDVVLGGEIDLTITGPALANLTPSPTLYVLTPSSGVAYRSPTPATPPR